MASIETPLLITNPGGTARYLIATVSASNIVSLVDRTTGKTVLIDSNPSDIDFIQMDINTSEVIPTTEGTLSWNATDHTLNIQSEIADSVLQVGQENWVRVVNKTGVEITDGKAVYIAGAQGNRPTISLAKADAENTSYTIGVTTAHIANNAEGYVTVLGLVRGFNTSGFTEGDPLWLSATTAGALVNVHPSAPSHATFVGYAMNSTNNGTIFVNPSLGFELDEMHDVKITSPSAADVLMYDPSGPYWKNVPVFADSKDPTGWLDNDNITVSYDGTARTITLTHASGTLYYYWKGQKKSLASPWTSSAHTATTDILWYLSSSDGVNFTWSTTVWTFYDLMAAVAYYGTTDRFAVREPHGVMQCATHEEFHRVIGTYRQSGGTLGGYTLNSTTAAERRPSVSATIIHDEDLETTNPALADNGPYTQLYLTSTGVNTMAVSAADIVPVLGNNPYYNSFTTPNWGQTLMANNSYMSVWLVAVPVAADATSQLYRYFWLQGQSNGTLAAQQALSPTSLNLSSFTGLFAEFVFIAQVIIRFTGGNWDFTSVVNLSGTRSNTTGSTSGLFLSAVSTDTTLTGLGTASSPLGVLLTTDALPVNTDEVVSLRGTGLLKTTWTTLKAFLKTYFDTLYNMYVLPTATASVLGGVKPDGTSILNTAGAISATAASVGADSTGTAASAVSTHAGLTTTHGVTGAIVGTTDTQTMSGKTFDQLKTSQTATTETYIPPWGTSMFTKKIPIVIGGVTYYMHLTES